MKRYRIGVIGLGARGETFARQLAKGTERAELCSVCDMDEERMEVFCDYCGVDKQIRRFRSPSKFFEQEDMDAVIVTTPDFTHLDVAEMAFAAGKHTYLEKPLEVSAERCRAIIEAHKKSNVTAYVGFNLRANDPSMKTKEIVQSGILGDMIQIDGLEQITSSHISAFMRRFHRKEAQSGGLLNTKCSHDLDYIQWLVGHENKITRVASFGGVRVFDPAKAPATHCHLCPGETKRACPYRDTAGFVFPIHGERPIHKTSGLDVYGGDLCVYNEEKELIDNQTVILEWDNGIHGSFNLQGFQAESLRETRIWGSEGLLRNRRPEIEVIRSRTNEHQFFSFPEPTGGHGGSDPRMLDRFIDAIQSDDEGDSGLAAGLAATLIAEKANEAMRTGCVVEVQPDEYA